MSYYYCEHCKDYKKKYHDCHKKSRKCYDKYDGYYEKCDKKYEEKPCVNVKVDCCNNQKDRLVRESAFRAVNNAPQNIAANTNTKVLFQTEQFDLAGEYNPNTSTFIPSKDGVYNIIAAASFDTQQVNRSALIGIRVNGTIVAAIDNDYFAPIAGFNFTNIVTATTILRLNAGDQVDVIARSSVAGFISVNNTDPNILNSTHFEAARFPSRSE
ncbi:MULTISPECIES: hypothetical protein [Bacillus cereus group]|uniref:C1q domain-containing protein n=1 Tax=Bacillus thuringiensis subsp. konkukian (strain 97-27) TaxID=281309 RepID=Q6HIA3_BACHK|nr:MULTISPECIES: hypothetical protein [Bacillus cereus group]AAT59998.1 hypothetical protein BT9727_2397 [[Bacillus thuringiensis] serovar konkukian str. 97-27]AJI36599.1 C1q domain protein [Bacillus thuringiensis]QKI25053.1 hypothetical protein FOC86_09090 [Bacillus thuringiensis]